jgi:hypothetical protein
MKFILENILIISSKNNKEILRKLIKSHTLSRNRWFIKNKGRFSLELIGKILILKIKNTL